MPRVGQSLACLVILLGLSCTQDVDDPANFSASNASSPSSSSAGSSSDGGPGQTETSNGDANNSTGSVDSSDGGPPGSTGQPTTGPVNPTGGGNGMCGDGMVAPGEQCDGAMLQGFDCGSLGLGSGTLACDPMTCTFDTSMCSGGGGGTGGLQ